MGVAHTYENVYAAVGVHPHEAARFAEERERVHALLTEDGVVAVGEIGLDFYRDWVPAETQLEAFREQLRWAREHDLPASIHNRAADGTILDEIRAAGARAVLHCFSGEWETAAAALDLGCAISFAGNVTFPRADSLRETAQRVPLDRLLVESDAPVLAPQGRRGRRNEPAYVAMTAGALAEQRGLALDALSSAIAENAVRVFAWEPA